MRVLIAGAGLGGLTAALCLKQAGHEVSVFESAPALGEIGAGIRLGGNAVRVLDSLGLRERLEAVSVRPEAILGRTEANWTGNAAWRATVETERLPADFMETVVSNFVGPRKHVVVYYLRRGKLVNMVGVVENDSWREEAWNVKAPWEDLKSDFAGWYDTVQTLIDSVPKDECYRWALFNRLPVDNWSTERATLLGDSAHATLPFMASGAAMAIEDARVLQRALEQESSVAAGLQCYQRNRFERTVRVVNGSTAMQRVYHQPDAAAFRKQFSAVRAQVNKGSAPPDQWLGEYDANTAPLV